MTDTLEREPKISVGKKPAGRWVNRYWFPRPHVSKRGNLYPAGEVDGELTHPSKDVAETMAAQSMKMNAVTAPGSKYLGAFPLDNTQ